MSARSKKAKQAEPGNTDTSQAQVAAAGTGEDTPPPASVDEPLVVGIGASAGGLEAYKAFFDANLRAGTAGVMFWILTPDPKRGYGVNYTTDRDRELFRWVRAFNPYDLYSKAAERPNVVALRPYYEELIAEFFPPVLQW